MKLDNKSSLLTTFNTPFGRYRFTRLPFGVNSAQDVFQKEIDLTYEGLPGVAAIVDDILVYGKNQEDHDAKLEAVLRRTRERGIKLNPDKCVFRTNQVTYFGHIWSAGGLRPDPVKTQGIRDMPSPTSREELETVLGMATYLGKFAPNLSDASAPLRDLTKKENAFIWDAVSENAYNNMKQLLFKEHDSRCMTSAEQNYAQIEKELLAVVSACERFHKYTYGRDITVQSDHKPLEAITNKPLSCAPSSRSSTPPSLMHESKRSELQ